MMKKNFKYFLAAILVGSLAIVSCTSDLKADIEKVDREQTKANEDLQNQINNTNVALEQAVADLTQAKAALEEALTGTVSEEGFQAALANFQAALQEIIGSQGEGVLNSFEALNAKVELYKTTLDQTIETRIAELKAYVDAEVEKLQKQIDELKREVAILKSRVQSIVFLPRYTDMKFGLPFSVVTDGTYSVAAAVDTVREITYKVSPDSLADKLAAHAQDVFTFLIVDHLKTRKMSEEPEPLPELTIVEAKGNPETGVIEFVLTQKNFHAYTTGNGLRDAHIDDYAIALAVEDSDNNIGISSEFTQSVLEPSPLIKVDMKNVYRLTQSCMTNAVGAEKVADENGSAPENLKLKYTGEKVVLYANTYLAATVHTENETVYGPYTYAQLDSLGFNMSDYVKHSVSEKLVTALTDTLNNNLPVNEYKTTVGSYVTAPVDTAFSPVSMFVDGTNKKMVSRKHEVGRRVGKTITYNTGIHWKSKVLRTAKVDIVQANDIYFKFTLDTLNWTYANDAYGDHRKFLIGALGTQGSGYKYALYNRQYLQAVKVEASIDGGATYKPFVDASDDFWGVEYKDFDGLTRKNFYSDAEAYVDGNTDVDGLYIQNPVFKGENKLYNTSISTHATYVPAGKFLTFGSSLEFIQDAYEQRDAYAFLRKSTLEDATTYNLPTRPTVLDAPATKNAGAYVLTNTDKVQYVAAKSAFSITTNDRPAVDIVITGLDGFYPEAVKPTEKTSSLNRFNVQLYRPSQYSTTNGGLYRTTFEYYYGGGYYYAPNEHYLVESGDVAVAMYNAFKAKGIFTTEDYLNAKAALRKEFAPEEIFVDKNDNTGYNAYFKLGLSSEAITLRSQGNYDGSIESSNNTKLLSSSRLYNLVQRYPDYEETLVENADRWITYEFYTYIGQKVTLLWSLAAQAGFELRSKIDPITAGGHDFNFIGSGSVMNLNDLIGIYPVGYNEELKRNVQLYYYQIGPNNTGDSRLVPEFTLKNPTLGLSIGSLKSSYNFYEDERPTYLKENSNMLYYSASNESVEVAGKLWIDSGSILFPVTSRIKFGSTEASSDPIVIYKPVSQPN